MLYQIFVKNIHSMADFFHLSYIVHLVDPKPATFFKYTKQAVKVEKWKLIFLYMSFVK